MVPLRGARMGACRILCKAAASGNHELMRGQPAHTQWWLSAACVIITRGSAEFPLVCVANLTNLKVCGIKARNCEDSRRRSLSGGLLISKDADYILLPAAYSLIVSVLQLRVTPGECKIAALLHKKYHSAFLPSPIFILCYYMFQVRTRADQSPGCKFTLFDASAGKEWKWNCIVQGAPQRKTSHF
jgi:hypothetical protein